MKFKKYLVGISMLLASATVFAKPNGLKVDGYFINNFGTGPFNWLILPDDSTDMANVTVDGVVIPPDADRAGGNLNFLGSVHYSIVVTSLKKNVMMRLYDINSGSICYWHFDASSPTNPPVFDKDKSSAGVCVLSGIYNFIMQK
jgi:hypothetical protein